MTIWCPMLRDQGPAYLEIARALVVRDASLADPETIDLGINLPLTRPGPNLAEGLRRLARQPDLA